MKSILRILLFLMISTIQSIALPVVINGYSAAGNEFVFRLYYQEDPISGIETLADQIRPNDDGFFMLGFETDQIQKVTIRVGLQSLQLFVQPGETYELAFNDITVKDQNVFLPQSPLRVEFKKDDLLNLIIDGFEYEYQRFLQNKFIDLMKYRDKSIYDQFVKSVQQKLYETQIDNENVANFFSQYIKYRLAEIRLASRLENRDSLGLKMIDQQPISFNNPAYSLFFKKYFNQYMIEYRGGNFFNIYQKEMNNATGLNILFDKMGSDPVLIREQIRELVLINALKEIYYRRQIPKNQINTYLLKLSDTSKFNLNRMIAANVYQSLIRFQKSYSVPEFNLVDQNSISKNNSSYKGKYTYLMFVSPQCETCETDIRLLKSLENKYKDVLQIVTIYASIDYNESRKWVQRQNASWDFLWFNDDFNLLNEYRVNNFPKYVLLDKDGSLLHYFPPKPREDFLSMITVLKEKETMPDQSETGDFFRKN